MFSLHAGGVDKRYAPGPSWQNAHRTRNLSGGGRTTTDLRLSHTAAHRRCPPVRCSAWFGAVLKEVTIDIKGAVKHPQDIYIAVGLEEIGNSVMSVEENPNVLMGEPLIAMP
jgi:hypothetical protein